MAELFETVNMMMTGTLFTLLMGSFIWGVLSIALSPCHLTSIPLIVGFIDGTEAKTPFNRSVISTFFALGILISIALIGVATVGLGRVAGDIGSWGNWFAAAVFAVIGFNFLDIISFNFSGISSIPVKRKGRRAAFLIGLIFGIALGPCSFAFMAPVLAVVFAKSETTTLTNSLVLIMYGLGHSLLIVLAGTFTGSLQKYLSWSSANSHVSALKKTAGIMLLAGSLYFVFKA